MTTQLRIPGQNGLSHVREPASPRPEASSTVRYHRDEVLALVRSAATWRAPLAPLSRAG